MRPSPLISSTVERSAYHFVGRGGFPKPRPNKGNDSRYWDRGKEFGGRKLMKTSVPKGCCLGFPLAMYPKGGYTSLVSIHVVQISPAARKDLRRVPPHVVDKLEVWVDSVEKDGLDETRKIPGYHDEPLLGDRRGQRSIRLNRSYRAIYEICPGDVLEFVNVEEVTKLEY